VIDQLIDPEREIEPPQAVGMAFFEMNLLLLADILLLPKGSKIVGVHNSPERKDVIELRIEGPGLPKTGPGERMTRVNPQYRRVFTSHPEFVSWSI
jgi:hypothetical protein